MEKKEKKIITKKKQNRYSDSIKKKAVQLYHEGKTASEIVEELEGPKLKAVFRYLHKAGIENPKKWYYFIFFGTSFNNNLNILSSNSSIIFL